MKLIIFGFIAGWLSAFIGCYIGYLRSIAAESKLGKTTWKPHYKDFEGLKDVDDVTIMEKK